MLPGRSEARIDNFILAKLTSLMRSTAAAKRLLKHGQKLDGPAVHRGMIHRNPTFGHHFFEMTQA